MDWTGIVGPDFVWTEVSIEIGLDRTDLNGPVLVNPNACVSVYVCVYMIICISEI